VVRHVETVDPVVREGALEEREEDDRRKDGFVYHRDDLIIVIE